MSGLESVLVLAAGLGAGILSSTVGVASLLSFPTLVALGLPPVTANVSNTLGLIPGGLGGVVGYRDEVRAAGPIARTIVIVCALGAVAGAALLLALPPGVFEAIVPWLILAACALLALGPRAAAIARRHHDRGGSTVALHAGLFVATLYGGYFGAGLGIVLLALLGALLPDDLQRLNALKGLLSLLVAGISAAGFALLGPVAWDAAVVVGVACLPGAVVGVRVARRLSPAVLRGVVIAFGVAVATVLLL